MLVEKEWESKHMSIVLRDMTVKHRVAQLASARCAKHKKQGLNISKRISSLIILQNGDAYA